MIVLFVLLPIIVMMLGFFRLSPKYMFCSNMGVLSVLAGVNFYEVILCDTVKKITIMNNFLKYPTKAGWESIELGIYVDFYTANMLWIVFMISFLVHVYSTSYMASDPRIYLFLSYLTLFTFFMVVLIVSPNYVQLFLGWEGVGLTSYLLVNFWHTRAAANKSALKALIVNRVGDFFLLYCLFLIIISTQTAEFYDIFGNQEERDPYIGIFLVIAASAKSAQLGLHTWLPDAMEGPTPVSALIHAATMVTAGVFLLLRSPHFIIEVRPFLLFLGSVTAFFAGSVALFQYDLKRVIAYSTCSQLGYMVVALSLDIPELSLYHLVNHAYFKALLFLLAGLVIHALADEQDTRRMGGLINILPVTYVLFVLASFALAGFPFLSGYYSKEGILEILYAKQYWFSYFCCLFAAYFTAYYSFRTIYLVFLGKPKGNKSIYLKAAEADNKSLFVVLTLAIFALFHGYLFKDLFIGLGRTQGWSVPYLEAEFAVPLMIKLMPLVFSILAVITVLIIEKSYIPFSVNIDVIYFFSKRWWWDFLDSTTARSFLIKSYQLYVDIERGLFEWLGPTGVRYLIGRMYDVVRNRGWLPTFFVSVGTAFAFLFVVYFIFSDYDRLSELLHRIIDFEWFSSSKNNKK